ncbi:hypothetical protein BJF85_07790 [Saccharomonospora sp. CUA-673]|nr:hypothetical protein BJF85_07790 [Saccharomonospora sp. CUA-673]
MQVHHRRRLGHGDAGIVAQEQVGEHVGAQLVEIPRGVAQSKLASHRIHPRVGGGGNIGRKIGRDA